MTLPILYHCADARSLRCLWAVEETGIEVDKPVYVLAVLDIGDNNPQSPGPEDLVAITMPPIDIVANGEVAVDLTLMDK